MLIGISDQMGAQTDRLRCEVCQNLILSPMNTGFLRPAVATVLTVYGIETDLIFFRICATLRVATVLTVYGIETGKATLSASIRHGLLQQFLPFTVLKRTQIADGEHEYLLVVATVLTVYGIETGFLSANKMTDIISGCNSSYRLRY